MFDFFKENRSFNKKKALFPSQKDILAMEMLPPSFEERQRRLKAFVEKKDFNKNL